MMQRSTSTEPRTLVAFYQLFALLTVSRLTSTLTHSTVDRLSIFNRHTLYLLPLINLGLLLLGLPIYLIHKRYGKNIIDCVAEKFSRRWAKTLGGFYAGYFLFSLIRDLTRFGFFMTTTIGSPFSTQGFVVMILLAALYCVALEFEPLARTGVVIAVLIVAMLTLITIVTLPSVFLDRIEPFSLDLSRAPWELLDYYTRSMEIIALAVLISKGKGNFKAGAGLSLLLITILSELFIFLPQATLGLYTKMLMYPFFEITTFFQQGAVQRTDAFYAGVWVFGVFIQVSLLLYLTEYSVRSISKGRFKAVIATVVAVLSAFVAVYIADHLTAEMQSTMQLVLDGYGLVMLVVPFLVLLALALQNQRQKRRAKKAESIGRRLKLISGGLSRLLLLAVMLSSITGCASTPHSRSLLFVEAMGIDREGEQLRVTVQVFDPTQYGGTFQQQEGQITRMDSAVGPSLPEALHNLALSNGKHILYSRNRFVILGEEVAKEGFLEVIDFLLRHREARSSLHVAAACGKASDVLQATMNAEINPALEMLRLLTNAKDYSLSVETRLLDIMNAVLEGSASPCMPAVRAVRMDPKTGEKKPLEEKGEEQGGAGEGGSSGSDSGSSGSSGSSGDESSILMEVYGIALFKSDKLVSVVPPEEVTGLLWLLGEGNGSIDTVEFAPGRRAAIQTYALKTRIDVDLSLEIPKFTFHFSGAGTLDSVEPNLLHEGDSETYRQIEEAYNEKIAEQCLEAARRVITEQRLDVCQLGRLLRFREASYWTKNHERWDEILPQCVIEVECDLELHRLGMTAGNKERGL